MNTLARLILCLITTTLLFACAQPQPVQQQPLDLPVLNLDPMPEVKSVPKDVHAEIMRLNEVHDWVNLVPVWGFPDYQVQTVLSQVGQAEWTATSLTVREDLQPVKQALLRWILDKKAGLDARLRYTQTKDLADHKEANRYVQVANQSGQAYLGELANYFKTHGYTYQWVQKDGQKRIQWTHEP